MFINQEEEEPRAFPSLLQLQQQNSAENQEIEGFYEEKPAILALENTASGFLDAFTEKQYANVAENLRKKASSLESKLFSAKIADFFFKKPKTIGTYCGEISRNLRK